MKRLEPTPIHKLSETLKDNTLYIKRDDLLPLSFGGNKARKAILFFEDLKHKNADCVVTYGSSSSNHCRVVANIACSLRIPCYIISPNEKSKVTVNSRMMDLFNANIVYCSVSMVKKTIELKIQELKAQGYNPYFIKGGGHGDLGTQAYVQAYEEIMRYEGKSSMYFDYIFHTSGTGTTQAGLICGTIIHGDTERQIIGISNARKNPCGGQVVLDSVNGYLASIGLNPLGVKVVNFIDDYVLDGYGSYNDEILQILKEVLINDGIPLDTTYTAKGFWGMKKYVKKNQISGKNILFIHTGGTPLFFDDLGGIC